MSDSGAFEPREARWEGSPARLDRALAELSLIRSRSRAAELVATGGVSVDGVRATKAGQRVRAGSRIAVSGSDRYVSRAAHKLVAGLDAFGIDPAGLLALDLGASTGGFTQVLLERGARAVQAIDVGHGQLVPELRDDPRVRLVEGCNARDLTAEALARETRISERPQLVVADLSFISLTLILPAIARTAAPDAALVLLVKPQFEVGRRGIREGIVQDPGLRAEAIRAVLACAAEHGYAARGLEVSPIVGAEGNREFLSCFVRADGTDPTEWEGRLAHLAGAPGPVKPRGAA